MFASDPLSLVFLFCMFLSGGFLLVTAALGAGHNLHIGAHDLHLGGHVGATPAAMERTLTPATPLGM